MSRHLTRYWWLWARWFTRTTIRVTWPIIRLATILTGAFLADAHTQAAYLGIGLLGTATYLDGITRYRRRRQRTRQPEAPGGDL